ncbi:MAG: hypothetical protein JSS76_20055 [Bacteroidetes bacterium]|nr:hypothetical protein [Bacteroidota bacterium]
MRLETRDKYNSYFSPRILRAFASSREIKHIHLCVSPALRLNKFDFSSASINPFAFSAFFAVKTLRAFASLREIKHIHLCVSPPLRLNKFDFTSAFKNPFAFSAFFAVTILYSLPSYPLCISLNPLRLCAKYICNPRITFHIDLCASARLPADQAGLRSNNFISSPFAFPRFSG